MISLILYSTSTDSERRASFVVEMPNLSDIRSINSTLTLMMEEFRDLHIFFKFVTLISTIL